VVLHVEPLRTIGMRRDLVDALAELGKAVGWKAAPTPEFSGANVFSPSRLV